jgi:formylglycine-generating enzyme required for sulfatase activity
LAALRRGRILRTDEKILLVIDQFEQWLLARQGEEDAELVAGLRQCDGEHVQAIVMVRDDFWMAATRFMRSLEIDLLPDRNIAAVDLFDLRHARKVLIAFGRAYGTLPENMADFSRDQESFLDQAIAGLAQDFKIVPVHLALFAEMVKGTPWTPATLRAVGGTRGVGVTFLEETFASAQANPKHRLHQKAAQAVLKALLPPSGTELKGQVRSEEELRAASGYGDRARDFEDLIHILDPELRLITPTDPASPSTLPPPSTRFYQLTHDYLVHSLRDWLTRKQRESRRGRAELRLAERSSLWNARPENRHLPSVLEWAKIRLLTQKKDWAQPERRMMRRAGRIHASRGIGLAILIALASWAGMEAYGHLRSAALVEALRTASTADVPPLIEQISRYRRWADPRLVMLLNETDIPSREHLHASLALLPNDATQVNTLYERLITATAAELPTLRDALEPFRSELTPRLWSEIEKARTAESCVLPSAAALAFYDPQSPRWEDLGEKISDALVKVNPVFLGQWLEALRPVQTRLRNPLAAIFRDKARPETEHVLATNILADYAKDSPDLLAELVMAAVPIAYQTLFLVIEPQAQKVLPVLRAEVAKIATFDWDDPPLSPSWTNPDSALTGRIEAAGGLVGERFAFCQTLPLDQFLAISEALQASGYRPIRFRPYADGPAVRAAGVWTRDGRKRRIAVGLTADETRKQDAMNRAARFIPVDIAGYVVAAAGSRSDRYAALWSEVPGDESRLDVGVTEDKLILLQKSLQDAGLTPRTLQIFSGSDGRQRYSGVWSRTSSAVTTESLRGLLEGKFEEEQAMRGDEWLIDIAVDHQAVRRDSGLPGGVKAGHPEARYAAIWTTDPAIEAVSVSGLEPAAHLQRARELIAQDYRPVSWSVAQIAAERPLVTASVWHRPAVSEQAKDQLAERQARAAVALIRLGQTEGVWPLLRHSADPRLRNFLINWLGPLGADARIVAAELEQLPPSTPTSSMDAVLFQPETSIRPALIQALGTYGTEGLSPGEREALIARLLEVYRADPDAGIHGAAAWTLREWGQKEKLEAIDRHLNHIRDPGDRRWYVNGQGQTFAVIDGPVEVRMGSSPADPERIGANEHPRRVTIPRRFAIADREVSIIQFQRFLKTHTEPRLMPSPGILNRFSPDPDGPWIGANWYAAAEYCNWLSEQEGIPRDQWCYEPAEGGAYVERMTIPADVLLRTGYRLPTEAEWEFACRAGTITSRYYGITTELLAHYAWYLANSNERARSCGRLLPNDLGLFDTLGNALEWMNDRLDAQRPWARGKYSDLINESEHVLEKQPRLLLGGSFANPPAGIRAPGRRGNAPSLRDTSYGFRLARTYPRK